MIRAEFIILGIGIIVLIVLFRVLRKSGKGSVESEVMSKTKGRKFRISRETVLYIVVSLGILALINYVTFLFFPHRWLSTEFLAIKGAIFIAVLAGFLQKSKQARTFKRIAIIAALLILGYIIWGPKENPGSNVVQSEEWKEDFLLQLQEAEEAEEEEKPKVTRSTSSNEVQSEWKDHSPTFTPYGYWSERIVLSAGHRFKFLFEGKVDLKDACERIYKFEKFDGTLKVILPNGEIIEGTEDKTFAMVFSRSRCNDHFFAMSLDKTKYITLTERRVE